MVEVMVWYFVSEHAHSCHVSFVFLELNSVSFQVFVVEFYLQSHTYFLKKLLLLLSAY
jgi:hypothetical protein